MIWYPDAMSCLPSNELKYGLHFGCQSFAFAAPSVVSLWTVASNNLAMWFLAFCSLTALQDYILKQIVV